MTYNYYMRGDLKEKIISNCDFIIHCEWKSTERIWCLVTNLNILGIYASVKIKM